jgi:hypothetical protein
MALEHQVSALMPSQIEFPVVAANGDVVQMFEFKQPVRSGHDGTPRRFIEEIRC